MPVTVTGLLASPLPGGTSLPLSVALLICYPNSNQLRIQYGGAGPFVPLAYNESDIDLPDPYRYGFTTRTDMTGLYTLQIPTVAETHPAANLAWSILLPDGRTVTGPPPVTGSYSIDDLLTAQGWSLTQGLVLVAPGNGTTQRGTASVPGSTTITVAFPGFNMPSAGYQLFLSPSVDSVTGATPEAAVTTKTVGGFTVTFSPGFTGTFDWLAWG